MCMDKISAIIFWTLSLFLGFAFTSKDADETADRRSVRMEESEDRSLSPMVVAEKSTSQSISKYPDLSTGSGYYGETGLWRVTSSEPLTSFGLRLSIHGEWFYFKEFLIKDDTTQRHVGDLSVGIVPYDNLELFALYQTFSTYNDKVAPRLHLSQGNITLGVRYTYPFLRYLSSGTLAGFTLNTKPGDSTYSLGSTGYTLKSITTFDGKGAGIDLIRIHLNLGAYLIPDNAFGEDLYIYSHYLLNMNEQRQFLFGFAVDFPLREERLLPFVEVSLGYPDGPGYASGGIKYQPFESFDLTLDLVAEFGIFRGTPRYAPTTQQYNIVAGISYGVKPAREIKVVKEKVIERVCDESCRKGRPELPTGFVKGFVYEEGGDTPIGNAIVIMEGTGLSNLATDPIYGDFTTPPIAPGSYNFSIIKEGYEPVMSTLEIREGEKSVVKFYLKKKIVEGSINVRVVDIRNIPIASPEIVAISGDKQIKIVGGPDGIYSAKLPAGKWYVVAKAENKLSSGKIVEVVIDQNKEVEFQLKDRPKEILIVVEKDRITLKKKIQFARNSSKIMGDSFIILDMVADAINNNPKIKKVKIEGHTDNTENREKSIKLSQERAEAVREYLIRAGISGDILEATGYGPDKPIASNKTSKGRGQNRRVEFVIEE